MFNPDNHYSVYMHVFPNDKVYIGMTGLENVEGRFGYKGCQYASQSLIWNAIKKYGWDNIEHIIIATHVSKESAENIERDLIALYDSANRKNGYNIELGGMHAGMHSESTKRKLSEQRKGVKRPEWLGKRLSEIKTGVPNYSSRKPIVQYDIVTGERIAEYGYEKQAVKELGISSAHLSSCLKGNEPHAGGYVWIFAEEETDEYVNERLNKARSSRKKKTPMAEVDIDTGAIIKAYESIAAFMRTGIFPRTHPILRSHMLDGTPFDGHLYRYLSAEEYHDFINKRGEPHASKRPTQG